MQHQAFGSKGAEVLILQMGNRGLCALRGVLSIVLDLFLGRCGVQGG